MAACHNIAQKAFRSSGVTLIELMITLVIASIIASVAYPSYQSQVKRGRRAAAQAHMMDIAQHQQEYLLNARAYAPDLATLNLTTPSDVSPFYIIAVTIDPNPPMSFTVSATPTAKLAQAGEVAMTLAGNGVRTPAGVW